MGQGRKGRSGVSFVNEYSVEKVVGSRRKKGIQGGLPKERKCTSQARLNMVERKTSKISEKQKDGEIAQKHIGLSRTASQYEGNSACRPIITERGCRITEREQEKGNARKKEGLKNTRPSGTKQN